MAPKVIRLDVLSYDPFALFKLKTNGADFHIQLISTRELLFVNVANITSMSKMFTTLSDHIWGAFIIPETYNFTYCITLGIVLSL